MSANDLIQLVYDGECPMCRNAAKVLKIRKAGGKLEIINARTDHPLVHEVKKAGYNLNDGIIVKYHNHYYHGQEAMHMLAMIGSPVGIINRLNIILFRSKIITAVLYPILKFIRSCLLFVLGVQNIKADESQPIFQAVFGDLWSSLPVVLKKRYANKPYTDDVVKLEGVMDIELSPITRLLKLFFRIACVLVPYEGSDIKTTVYSRSHLNSDSSTLDRYFDIGDSVPYNFKSKFMQISQNEVLEITRYGMAWRCSYHYEHNKIVMKHIGYVWKIFGFLIPMPTALLLGKAYAEEQAIDEDTFRMRVVVRHPWFGKTFEYRGVFKVV